MERNVRYMREDSSQDESNVEFAVHGDEQDILDLLLSEFDIRSDNLPELSEIAANISRKQVLLFEKMLASSHCIIYTAKCQRLRLV